MDDFQDIIEPEYKEGHTFMLSIYIIGLNGFYHDNAASFNYNTSGSIQIG